MKPDLTVLDEFERGVDRGKYAQLALPIAAIAVGVYLLSTGKFAGFVVALILFTYAMVWIFANVTAAIVVILGNLAQSRRLWSQLRRPVNPSRKRGKGSKGPPKS